jgi:hypothetical protein
MALQTCLSIFEENIFIYVPIPCFEGRFFLKPKPDGDPVPIITNEFSLYLILDPNPNLRLSGLFYFFTNLAYHESCGKTGGYYPISKPVNSMKIKNFLYPYPPTRREIHLNTSSNDRVPRRGTGIGSPLTS